MKEDLVAGIKNALERGQSLEAAMQSLISAGYDANEVKDSANYVNAGSTNFNYKPVQQTPPLQAPQNINSQITPPNNPVLQEQNITQQNQYQKLPTMTAPEKPKKKFPKLMIILLIILLILIGGLVTLAFAGPKILDLFFK